MDLAHDGTGRRRTRCWPSPPVTLLRVDAPRRARWPTCSTAFTPGSGRATVYARLLRTGEVTLVYGRGGP